MSNVKSKSGRSHNVSPERIRVETFLKERAEGFTTAEVAKAAKIQNRRASNLLSRLHHDGQISLSRQDRPGSRKAKTVTVRVWTWIHERRRNEETPMYVPHLNSTMPNGDQDFWKGFMQRMNSPARVELNTADEPRRSAASDSI